MIHTPRLMYHATPQRTEGYLSDLPTWNFSGQFRMRFVPRNSWVVKRVYMPTDNSMQCLVDNLCTVDEWTLEEDWYRIRAFGF